MPLRISRLGGTSLRRSFITNVYWAVMGAAVIPAGRTRGYSAGAPRERRTAAGSRPARGDRGDRIGEPAAAARTGSSGAPAALDEPTVRTEDLDRPQQQGGRDADRSRHVSTRPGRRPR